MFLYSNFGKKNTANLLFKEVEVKITGWGNAYTTLSKCNTITTSWLQYTFCLLQLKNLLNYCSFHAILPKWQLKNIYTGIPKVMALNKPTLFKTLEKSVKDWLFALAFVELLSGPILWFVLLNHLGFLVWSDTPWASNSPIFGDPNLLKVNKICISIQLIQERGIKSCLTCLHSGLRQLCFFRYLQKSKPQKFTLK